MRVAVIHEWLTSYAGSERTLEQILKIFPGADVFCLVDFLPEAERGFLGGARVQTSFLQRMPFARKNFRRYLLLFPLAVEQFDLAGYDLVVSNSHSVAKGATIHPHQLHISLCCSPIRYAWDLRDEYLREAGVKKGLKLWIARMILHYLRIWDAATSHSVDHYVAISHFIARRIRKFYGRSSTVIYPPVDVEGFAMRTEKDDFYLAASRQVPYKKVHLIVEAFRNMPSRKLVVIGDGPESEKIAAMAKGAPNITLMGYQPTGVLKDHMQRAKAFLFAAKEDFGIIVLEAQACGTPVIAYREGGSSETVRDLGAADEPTGLLFDEQSAKAIEAAVDRFEILGGAITAQNCRANAEKFATDQFRSQLEAFIAKKITEDSYPPEVANSAKNSREEAINERNTTYA